MRLSTIVLAVWSVACGGESTALVGPPAPGLFAADGAALPILHRGQAVVLEGQGFGSTQGAGHVFFTGGAGERVEAPVAPDAWFDGYLETVVPDLAVTGPALVVTDLGATLAIPVTIAARPSFDPATLTWTPRAPLPRATAGLAAATGQHLTGSSVETLVFVLVGGADLADSTRVYVGFANGSGAVAAWEPRSALPTPRAYAALIVATPHSSRRASSLALYVVGGMTPGGEPLGSVIGATVTMPGAAVGEWVSVASLPRGLVAPQAVLHRGTIYVTGGTDAAGVPSATTYVARIRADGALEGWFVGPSLPAPLAYHGSVLHDTLLSIFGGADGVAPPGALDTLEARRASGADTPVSRRSGYYTAATWADEGPILIGGRSRFATLTAGEYVLAVGGLYPGASDSAAETVAALVSLARLGPFSGPIGTNSIAGSGGGVLVGAVGVWWHDLDGTAHGLVAGGTDLLTAALPLTVWGY